LVTEKYATDSSYPIVRGWICNRVGDPVRSSFIQQTNLQERPFVHGGIRSSFALDILGHFQGASMGDFLGADRARHIVRPCYPLENTSAHVVFGVPIGRYFYDWLLLVARRIYPITAAP
jgi:hypothetical protein